MQNNDCLGSEAKMFFTDLKRGLINGRMLLVVLIAIFLFLLSDYSAIFDTMTFADLNAPDLEGNTEAMEFIQSNGYNKYQIWLKSFSFIGILFPLLVMLPYSASYWEERQTKYQYYIVARTSLHQYVRTKFIVNGLVGGLAIFIPEFLYYIVITILFRNEVLAAPVYQATGPFSELYFSLPELYIGIVLLTHFLIGCTFAAMGMCISTFTKKKIVIYVLPFLLYMGTGILLEGFLGWFAFSPLQWINMMSSFHADPFIMYSSIILLIAASMIIFEYRGKMVTIHG